MSTFLARPLHAQSPAGAASSSADTRGRTGSCPGSSSKRSCGSRGCGRPHLRAPVTAAPHVSKQAAGSGTKRDATDTCRTAIPCAPAALQTALGRPDKQHLQHHVTHRLVLRLQIPAPQQPCSGAALSTGGAAQTHSTGTHQYLMAISGPLLVAQCPKPQRSCSRLGVRIAIGMIAASAHCDLWIVIML